jgi:NAD(P)-dependent dehydrogenase (short-subunit alcohol dehydrogenase family)
MGEASAVGGMTMTGRLSGRVAIVTGAGSIGPGWGNGNAVAALFAREGAKVLAVDLSADAAAETKAIIEKEGGTCEIAAADVSRGADVKALVEACVKRWGRIDVLHNNVGILDSGGPVEESEEVWDRTVRVNLKSMFLTCKYVLPQMLRQFEESGRGGAIVNIGSIAGMRYTGVPYIGYSTTKGAVVPFTRAIAMQYAAKGIRCNAVLPGLMNTPMVHKGLAGAYSGGDVEKMVAIRDAQCPTGKMGDAWDVAHAALFLASDEAKYITGVALPVDGGITLKFS